MTAAATTSTTTPTPTSDTYAATSLQASGRWSAGSNTGGFSWSYPITVPSTLGGSAPPVALDYNSSSVDGRTLATNAQTSWIGEGFDYQPGFIERSYKSCKDAGDGTTITKDANGNTIPVTGDSCWAGQNATISFGGHSTELVRDDSTPTSSKVWRLADDDGSSLQLLTGAANGSGSGTGGTNGDGAAGEYWKLTTKDGTAYYFGANHLPGGTGADPATGSAWTAPVYSNNAGEPCYNKTFASSWCQLAWRWNLDYVVDPHGNLTTYSYQNGIGSTQVSPELNAYARGAGTGTVTSYTRGGTLQSITYGIRLSDALAVAAGTSTVKPAAKVLFTSSERCTNTTTGFCVAANRTTANQKYWPDTPLDQACSTTATSCTQHGPSFWSSLRLSQIDTQVLSGSSYTTVDTYQLTPSYQDPKESPLKPTLTLASIVHIGQVGASLKLAQPVTFSYVPLANLVDGGTSGLTLLHRFRLQQITTEAGETISITYSSPQCSRLNATMPASPDTNTMACFPAWWTPPNGAAPILDWFNIYTVAQVVEADNTNAGSPARVTSYTYGGGTAWHRDDSELTLNTHRTWDQFRGYATVDTMTGQAGSTVVTSSVATYLRGMNGDATAAGGTKSVTVTGAKAPALADDNWLAGRVRETDTNTQEGGTLLSASYTDPYVSAVGSTHLRPNAGGPTLPALTSRIVEDGTTTHLELVTTGPGQPGTGTTWRTSRIVKSYNQYGLVTSLDDTGDNPGSSAATDPERCTATTYATSPNGAYMVSYPATVITYAGACTTPNAATGATPTNSVSGIQTLYDHSSTPGVITSVGDATSVSALSSWNTSASPATPVYTQTSAATDDVYGRPTSSTDALGMVTSTAYTPAAGALPTTVVTSKTVNGNAWKTTTVLEPGREQPLTVTDPNGKVTSTTYDALGRVTAVWKPGRLKASQTASLKYSYLIPGGTTPPAVTTSTLTDGGPSAYLSDITIYDGLLRPRQEQKDSLDGSGSRTLSDTYYDSHGWVVKTNNTYPDPGTSGPVPPSTTLYVVPDNQVAGQNATFYDGMGRPTAQTYSSMAVEQWRTTMAYPGLDRVDTTPPAGGTATTVFSDARGHTTAHWDYNTPTPTGNPADADKTTYAYDAGDHETRVIDAAGNQWTYQYDQRGRRTQANDPDAGASSMTYTNDNQPQTVTTPTGTVAYVYDAIGRKIEMHSGSTTGTILAQWGYDAVSGAWGQLSSSSRTDNGNAYTTTIGGYNVHYEPTSTTVTIPSNEGALASSSSNQYTLSMGYTAVLGMPSSTTYTALAGLPAETVYDTYNSSNMLGSVDGSDYYLSNIYWTPLGQVAATNMGGATQTSVTPVYDNGNGRLLTSDVNVQNQSSPLDHIAYSYNAHGDTTSISDTRTDGTTSQGVDTQCFQYDQHDRLTQAWTDTGGVTRTAGQSSGGVGQCTNTTPTVNSTGAGAAGTVGGPTPYWQQWSYDLVGNRTSQTDHSVATTGAGTSTTYGYSAPGAASAQPHAAASSTTTDLLTQATTATAAYGHNSGGQTTTRPAPASSTGGSGSQSLTYTVDGHLASLTQTGGATPGTTSYVYDADGNQLIKRSPGSTTLYLFGQEITAGAQAGTLSGVRYYTNPAGTPSTGVTVARTSSGAITYLIADPHGSSTIAIDATTHAPTRRDTTPYGSPRATSPNIPWVGQNGFVGGTLDPGTGLTLLGARNYDPRLGQFTTIDPIISDTPQQLNAYDYACDNPTTQTDPTGLRPDPADDSTWRPSHSGSGGTNPAASLGVSGASATSSIGGTGNSHGLTGMPCTAVRGCGIPHATSGPGRSRDQYLQYCHSHSCPQQHEDVSYGTIGYSFCDILCAGAGLQQGHLTVSWGGFGFGGHGIYVGSNSQSVQPGFSGPTGTVGGGFWITLSRTGTESDLGVGIGPSLFAGGMWSITF